MLYTTACTFVLHAATSTPALHAIACTPVLRAATSTPMLCTATSKLFTEFSAEGTQISASMVTHCGDGGGRGVGPKPATTHHCKTVADPHAVPAPWAGWDLKRLTVNRNDVGGNVAHHAARYVGHKVTLAHRHHGNGGVGGEPVGLVVSTGVVADVVHVAEEEGHGAEARQARPSPACWKTSIHTHHHHHRSSHNG